MYRSVGDDGVVVFSDQPPAPGVDSQVLQLPASPPEVDAAAKLQALRESNDRLAQARREREAMRADATDPTIRYTAPPGVPVGVAGSLPQAGQALWPYPLTRSHYHGPLRPWPPFARPPPARVPPGFRVIQPGNQQLMRPIVSSRD